ncbi:hypothetical protein LY39_02177 [Roseinatronobacter bogoriensis subsp. barguzinensis]|nr:hypothetical protein [Rhodobaca bogoriensis DSM 18756]TDW39146.1 hypothetical protein LY39_02177 [Rhodobaca barguzinensis]TDY66466.1 hypothetical protein EV660_11176 [Rhodobaca bogoriensis DSM 18756]
MIKIKARYRVSDLKAIRCLGSLLVLPFMAACAADPNVRRVDAPVSSISVGEPGDVSADALALAMLRVGFTPQEILDLGPSIRRSLTQSGGAQARRGGELVALLSIWQGTLYVTSNETGTFVVEA